MENQNLESMSKKNRKSFGEKAKLGKFPQSLKIFLKQRENLKQGMHHCFRGMDATGDAPWTHWIQCYHFQLYIMFCGCLLMIPAGTNWTSRSSFCLSLALSWRRSNPDSFQSTRPSFES